MTKGIQWLERSAASHYLVAAYALARTYFEGNVGKGLRPNYFKSMEWLDKLPPNKVASAHEIMGLMMGTGLGMELSKDNALKNLEKAVELGSKTAQYHIAVIYMILKDYPNAIEKLQKVPEGAYYYAAKTARGWLSLNGYGVEKSEKDAMQLFEQASQEDALGKWYYAMCLENVTGTMTSGVKTPKELYEESKTALVSKKRWPSGGEWLPFELGYWVEKAANVGGHARAQMVLGQMYERGIGFVPSEVEAVKWYKSAMDSGYKVSEEVRKMVESGKAREDCYCVIF